MHRFTEIPDKFVLARGPGETWLVRVPKIGVGKDTTECSKIILLSSMSLLKTNRQKNPKKPITESVIYKRLILVGKLELNEAV